MSNSRRRTSFTTDEEELASITALIDRLSIRKQELQNRIGDTSNSEIDIDSLASTPIATTVPIPATTVSITEEEETEPPSFAIGDTVRVLSNYKGRYGTIGIIKQLTPAFAYIKSSRYSYRIQVQLNNLEHYHGRR